MDRIKKAKFKPVSVRYQRLARAYAKSFKSMVPHSKQRGIAMGTVDPAEVEKQLAQALQEGRPVPEWEKEFAQIKAMDQDNLPHEAIVQQQGLEMVGTSTSPAGSPPGKPPPRELDSLTKQSLQRLKASFLKALRQSK
ncbi:MAG: hypothetical protein WCR74_05860 [Betaproteobacteria bacterium]